MASQSSDQRVTVTDDAPSDGSTQQQLETINISPQLMLYYYTIAESREFWRDTDLFPRFRTCVIVCHI